MKGAIDGMSVSDPDIGREMAYFLCAYYFHWTPEQVDRTDHYTVESCLYMLGMHMKKEAEMMKR